MKAKKKDQTKKKGLKVKTKVKVGAVTWNHSEKLVCSRHKKGKKCLKVKTSIKAGALTRNHSEKLIRDQIKKGGKGLKVKTNIKAGAGMILPKGPIPIGPGG